MDRFQIPNHKQLTTVACTSFKTTLTAIKKYWQRSKLSSAADLYGIGRIDKRKLKLCCSMLRTCRSADDI